MGVKGFRKKSCFLVINDQIHGSCMECDDRKSEFKSFHNNHRPSFPSGWKKENRRIQIILLWFIGITDKVYSVLNVASFRICYNLIPEITGSYNIQLPFIIIFTEFFKRFHHQIKALGIYKTGCHQETLGLRITFTVTDKASRIDLDFRINIEEFFIIPLVIIAEYDISVQFWKIFLKKAFLLPENNVRDIQISGIAVVLPANRFGIQIRCQHAKTQTQRSGCDDNVIILFI